MHPTDDHVVAALPHGVADGVAVSHPPPGREELRPRRRREEPDVGVGGHGRLRRRLRHVHIIRVVGAQVDHPAERARCPSGIEGGDPGSWMVIPATWSTRLSTSATAVGVLDELSPRTDR